MTQFSKLFKIATIREGFDSRAAAALIARKQLHVDVADSLAADWRGFDPLADARLPDGAVKLADACALFALIVSADKQFTPARVRQFHSVLLLACTATKTPAPPLPAWAEKAPAKPRATPAPKRVDVADLIGAVALLTDTADLTTLARQVALRLESLQATPAKAATPAKV